MRLGEFSVRKPVTVLMAFLLAMVLVVMAFPHLATSQFPKVTLPVISVSVPCPSAGPDEIEEQVVKPLEDSLDSLESLDTMHSQSGTGYAYIILQFDYGTDLHTKMMDVNNKVQAVVSSLPSWANMPSVLTYDVGSNDDIMSLIVSGEASDTVKLDAINNIIKPALGRVEGVSKVTEGGLDTKEYQIQVDPNRLAALGLTLSQVVAAVAPRTLLGTLGSIEDTSSYKYSIVIDTRYQKPSQILDTAIETVDGHTVRVKDVAGLAYVSTNDSSHVTIDGKPAVALDIANTSDSNSIQVVKAVKKALPSIQALLPGGVTLQTYSDNTAFVASTINSVGINAIEGILLAALIIFIFLRNRKAAFIISLSMPISIFGTIGLMNMMGYTMNVVSMSGLILGIGMIVDASIVILENIYKKEEAGMEPLAASIEGSHEMTSAVFASMLTSVCVFFPMYMYHNQLGIIGVMVEGFLFAIMSCLILSFIVATTLVPALAGPILKMKTHRQQPLKNRFLAYVDQKMSNFESKVTTFYGRSINYALDHRLLLISLFVALLLFFVSFVPHMNKSLLTPVKTSDSMIASLTYADGTSQHVVEKELDRVEKELSAKLDSAAYTSIRCTAEDNEGTLTISLPPADEQPLDFQQLSDAVRPVLEGNPLAKWTISQAAASMASSAVDVEIFSTDSKSAKVASDRLMDALKRKVPDVTNLKSDAVAGAPRLRIVPDQKRLDALGITASQIEATLYTAIGGAKAATITSFDSNDSRDLVVTLAPRFVDDISALGSLMIDTSVGKVRLDSIAAIEDSVGPTIIYREDKRRINHITADAVDGVSTSQVNAEVQEVVKAVVLPEGVNLSLAGQMSDFADADATFRTVLLLALALVFTVMASQFESIKDPFIIFVSIPLLLIGVIAIHLIMGMDITMFSLIGIIALVGIVVNNGIVLVDAINGLVARKIPVKQACRMAAESRLRPILMTTLTTILGMIPLGFFPGAGSELMQPVAVTIIGGIISGAFLTLFLTPIVYSIVQKNKLEKMFNDKDSNANQLIRYDVLKKEKERA